MSISAAMIHNPDSGVGHWPWLRVIALAAAVAAHAGLLLRVNIPRPALPTPLDTIEISIAPPQGEAVPETSADNAPDSVAQPDVQPDMEPKPDEVQPPPEPMPPPPEEIVKPAVEPPPEIAAEPPKREAPDAPAIKRQPKPIEREKPKVDRKKILEERRRREQVIRDARRRVEARHAAAQSARKARAGVDNGSRQNAMSPAAYGGKVRAEIQRHKVDPGEGGSVGVFFVVGSSGGVISASVIHSSGNGRVDSAGLRAVRSAHPGPPPGGSFSASTTIHFVQR